MGLTAEQLEQQGGAAINIFASGPKLVPWYTPWGKKLMLPSDPWSYERYSLRGFTRIPPANPIPEPRSGVGNGDDKTIVDIESESKQLALF